MINIKQILGLETLIEEIPTGYGFIQTGIGQVIISGDLSVSGQLSTSGDLFSSGQIFLIDTRQECARIEINPNELRTENGIYIKVSNTGTEAVSALVSNIIYLGESYLSGNNIYSKSGVSIKLDGDEKIKIGRDKVCFGGSLQNNNILLEELSGQTIEDGRNFYLDTFDLTEIDFKKYKIFIQGLGGSAGIDATVSSIEDSAYLRYSTGIISGVSFSAEKDGDSAVFAINNSSGGEIFIKWYSESYLKISGTESSESSHSSESSSSSSS